MRKFLEPASARSGEAACRNSGSSCEPPVRHRPSTITMHHSSLILLLATITPLCAEAREWTSSDGRVIEAEFIGSQQNTVTLKLKDGREVPVDLGKLSPADQEFVKTLGPGRPAAKKLPGFADVVLDKKSWGMRPQPDSFGVTGVVLTQQLETPHFLITAGPKIKPALMEYYAEVCERLYAQMARDISGLAERSTEKRTAVWLTADKEEHARLGECLDGLGASGSDWGSSSISSVFLSEEMAESKKVFRSSRGFNMDYEAGAQRNLLWPQRIHFMASTILASYGHSSYRRSNRSFEMFNLSYCYFLENEITGKVETKVRFSDSAGNVEGFKNPRGWPSAVKRILDSSPLRPSLRRFMSLDSSEAEPMDVGSGFGLMQFVFRDPARKAAMNGMMECGRKDSPPDAEAFAKEMGFGSPEEFDLAWIAFLKSDAFK